MSAVNQQNKNILLTISIIAIGLIIISSLLVISRTFEAKKNAITIEMTEKAVSQLIEKYGENNFLLDKSILQSIQRDLNTYRGSRFFKEGMQKFAEYKTMIYEELDKNNLHREYIFIPFVESQYNPDAHNKSSGAKGMWQLMPETAKSFGLRVNESVDERYDPLKSTVAATRFLKYLQERFGSQAFTIIIAAYNAGEGTITKSIRKMDSRQTNIDFWKLYKNNLIPGQTKAFVIRVITFLILAEGLIRADS